MTITVATLGFAAVDHLFVIRKFPELGAKSRIVNSRVESGGQAVTAASALSRWGVATRCIARVGDDREGIRICDDLEADGVVTDSILTTLDAKTQHASICIEAISGERTIFWERNPRLDLQTRDLKREWFEGLRWLLIDGHEVEADIKAAEWVRSAGGRVLLDAEEIGPERDRLLSRVDVCIASNDFGRTEFGIDDPLETLSRLAGYGIATSAVTLGKDGVIANITGESISLSGIPVRAIDTTGAGDILHAGFLFGMLQNWTIRASLEFANRAAALSCEHLGGRPGIPSLEQILSEPEF